MLDFLLNAGLMQSRHCKRVGRANVVVWYPSISVCRILGLDVCHYFGYSLNVYFCMTSYLPFPNTFFLVASSLLLSQNVKCCCPHMHIRSNVLFNLTSRSWLGMTFNTRSIVIDQNANGMSGTF